MHFQDTVPKNISKALGKRKRIIKRSFAAFGVLLALYIYGFGDYVLYQYLKRRTEEKLLTTEMAQLKAEAQQIELEKNLISRRDPDYLQKIAREKFGLVKPGEKIYILTPYMKDR